MSSILRIQNLAKHFRSNWTFRKIQAVKNVSLDVQTGESFGFLGPNGAGKTTSIKCILGLIKKTAGEIYFKSEALSQSSQHSEIGYLPELPYFYEHLSVKETLEFFARLYGLNSTETRIKVAEVLDKVGLSARKQAMVKTLSKGLQQRLGFAQAILNHPSLLILDEPFSGLDPTGRREMRELIFDLKSKGSTIFLSSHILSDVEEICDRVSIMTEGEIQSVFSIRDIPRLFGQCFELSLIAKTCDLRALNELSIDALHKRDRKTTEGLVRNLQFGNYESAERALQQAAQRKIQVLSFNAVGLRLEDVFLQITEKAKQKKEKEHRPSISASSGAGAA